MLYLVGILALLGILFYFLSARYAGLSSFTGSKIIYSDTRMWGIVNKPLYSQSLRLTGKPDYLFEKYGLIIPVEIKTSKPPSAPFDSHIYQLAAYCLLVESLYGKRPHYGLIHYGKIESLKNNKPVQTYKIEFTSQLENNLIALLDEMRILQKRNDIPRSHNQLRRCQKCGYGNICNQRLR